MTITPNANVAFRRLAARTIGNHLQLQRLRAEWPGEIVFGASVLSAYVHWIYRAVERVLRAIRASRTLGTVGWVR